MGSGLAEARLSAEPGLAPHASRRKERFGASAPRRLGPDPVLGSRGAAVPAPRRPGRRCFVMCGF